MHHKRRRRRTHRAPKILLGILLLAVLGAGTWFAWPMLMALVAPTPTAVLPQSTVKGLVLRTGEAQQALLQGSVEEQKAHWNAALDYAVEKGFNAVLVEATQEGAGKDGGLGIVYRDKAFATLPVLTQEDTFFKKFDTLAYVCQRAATQNIAVYALMPESIQTDEKLQKSAERLRRHYAIAGTYRMEPGADAAQLATLVPLEENTPKLFMSTQATWQNPSAVFLAAVQEGYPGVMIDDYTSAQLFPDVLSVMESAFDTKAAKPQPLSYTPQTALSVTYPAADAKIYTAQCFIMGTSDPALPLTLDGQPIERTATSGLFGVLVNVQQGENIYTFAQGAQQTALRIEQPAPKSGAGGSTAPAQDGTQKVEQGSYVQTTGWINSVLHDPSSDDKISETVRGGTMARVIDCVQTRRSGKKTWAYQLASGDFVMAYNTTYLEDAPTLAFTGAQAQSTPQGETLTFAGSGQPLIYANCEENTLLLHLYDTDLPETFSVAGSEMVKAAGVQKQENYTQLMLQFDAPLYGFDITFENGTLVLKLKRTPVQSSMFGKPLQGVTVLLDAGHGADDFGAVGIAGTNAPVEKDVNLAVSLAAKYRLEQMGATVEMVRTDDTFLSLEERNRLISEKQPDYFIAVHHNSVELTTDANESAGVEAYYFYNQGEALAQSLVTQLCTQLPRAERGAKWGYYYVARNTTCPSVLLEVGFMVNPVEYEAVINPNIIWSTGDAIAQAVLQNTPKQLLN